MMLSEELLNGAQLQHELGISSFMMYKMIKHGMPYRQLGSTGRKYYYLPEVEDWLIKQGFVRKTKWTK
ncbi:hypothetical protein [Limosilactobacillus equigenerosi]|uniref:Helix-turn-helix domain-containing protein n=1 Tax=Limosilactobacillus equigenerosi DSM 18793 = JCM 14505 TaxID=1423742 RepID=A0A0R1UTH1_9LACO|nr:hypothetical protein [Limosilactobacillus equigenerosi]KRL96068.1 hypothetical protein FC21_GL000509 [Limosilactobacillus equigenerosi DSM 18793 = JCM 14505]